MAKESVKYLNLDPVLGLHKNRVARIGVELEGGWTALPAGTALERDGSVFKDNRSEFPDTKFGELPIGPFIPAALPKFMKKYYPQRVDATCGMHVHMSFERQIEYQWLMKPEYQETIVEYLSRWAMKENFPQTHHIWGRLQGKSIFCQKKWWPEEQANNKGPKSHDQSVYGHRYTIVNYSGRTNTIEVRVLPMMTTYPQAIRAVNQVIDITNASLYLLGKRDLRVKGRVELSPGEFYEEVVEKAEEIPLTLGQRRRLRNVG